METSQSSTRLTRRSRVPCLLLHQRGPASGHSAFMAPATCLRRYRTMLTIDTDQGRATEVDAGSAVEEADVAVAAHLARVKDHPVMRFVGALSEVGDQPQLTVISSAVLAYGVVAGDRRAARAGMRMLGSLAIAFGLKTALKHLVARTRPNLLLDQGALRSGAVRARWRRMAFLSLRPHGRQRGGRIRPRQCLPAGAHGGLHGRCCCGARSGSARGSLPAGCRRGRAGRRRGRSLREAVTQSAFGTSDVERSPSDGVGSAFQEVSAHGRRVEDSMVIRGESTLEQIDTIATNEKFRIRPLSESLATSSDGPNAGFLRYLATEPTVVDALAYSGATSGELRQGPGHSSRDQPRRLSPSPRSPEAWIR